MFKKNISAAKYKCQGDVTCFSFKLQLYSKLLADIPNNEERHMKVKSELFYTKLDFVLKLLFIYNIFKIKILDYDHNNT